MLRLRRRLIAWAVIAVGLPVLTVGLRKAADALEARRGQTPAVDRLRKAGAMTEDVGTRLRGKRKR